MNPTVQLKKISDRAKRIAESPAVKSADARAEAAGKVKRFFDGAKKFFRAFGLVGDVVDSSNDTESSLKTMQPIDPTELSPVTQAMLGLAGSAAAVYGGLPLLRRIIVGEAFPKYKIPGSTKLGETSLARDVVRQTFGTVIGLPSKFLTSFLVSKILADALGLEAYVPPSLPRDWSDERYAKAVEQVPASSAIASVVSGLVNAALVEPLTRSFEYGDVYPTYVTSSGKKIRHNILHDLLYGLMYSTPEALAGWFSSRSLIDKLHKDYLKSVEKRDLSRVTIPPVPPPVAPPVDSPVAPSTAAPVTPPAKDSEAGRDPLKELAERALKAVNDYQEKGITDAQREALNRLSEKIEDALRKHVEGYKKKMMDGETSK